MHACVLFDSYRTVLEVGLIGETQNDTPQQTTKHYTPAKHKTPHHTVCMCNATNQLHEMAEKALWPYAGPQLREWGGGGYATF